MVRRKIDCPNKPCSFSCEWQMQLKRHIIICTEEPHKIEYPFIKKDDGTFTCKSC